MNVVPLAADSMGVRSAATLVETASHRIVIDPSAALAPKRFELTPSALEEEELGRFKTDIVAAVDTSDIIVISHYHHDHFDPGADFYEGRRIFMKSWKSDINFSQKERAKNLLNDFKSSGVISTVTSADGERFTLEDGVDISFSHAVPHGPVGTNIGYVIMTCVRENDFVFIHCSDVGGPVESSTAGAIIAAEPDLVYLDGPPTHLIETHFSRPDLDKAINNILDIITLTRAVVILDHHLLRDNLYKILLKDVYERSSRVKTAAEYLGVPNRLLEANRDKL